MSDRIKLTVKNWRWWIVVVFWALPLFPVFIVSIILNFLPDVFIVALEASQIVADRFDKMVTKIIKPKEVFGFVYKRNSEGE